MKVALFSDVHGNLVALDAVLNDIEAAKPDRIICLGDVAATGPQPRSALARIRDLNVPVVMGNTDERLLHPTQDDADDDLARVIADIDRWCRRQLSPDELEYIRTFPPTLEIDLDGRGSLLCFHGSPRSNTDLIYATTSADALEEMVAGVDATVLAGGHTHVQMLRRYKNLILLNPGSVGLPHTEVEGQLVNPPWAEWALVEWGADTPTGGSVELRRVPVDVAAIRAAALNSGMPHADVWVRDWRTHVT